MGGRPQPTGSGVGGELHQLGGVGELCGAVLVLAEQVGHDPQHPPDQVLCMPTLGEFAHQRGPADDLGEQAGLLGVVGVYTTRAALVRHYGYDLETGMLDTIQAGWDTTPSDLTGNTWFQYDRYTRDPVGNVTVIEDRGLEPGGAGSNIKECFVYDEWNRLVRAHTAPGTTDGSETVGCATSTGTNITARGATSPYDRTWSFDDINRITGSADKANGNATTTWGYSSTKHAVLSLTGQTSGSYSYNTVGAMVSRNGDTLTYDPQQRLTGYDTSSVDDTYLYTTSNQRLIRQHGSTVTLYLGDMEIGYDGTNTTVTRSISIAGTLVATRTTLNGGTASIAWNCGNMQNSTICQTPAATTANPPIPGRKRYTPYGDDRNTTPTWATDHGFLGQPEDTTGLTYLNNRYHDPMLAAFITVDPLVGKTGQPYLYGSGSPVTLSDPSGLEPCPRTGCTGSERELPMPSTSIGGTDPAGLTEDDINSKIAQVDHECRERLPVFVDSTRCHSKTSKSANDVANLLGFSSWEKFVTALKCVDNQEGDACISYILDAISIPEGDLDVVDQFVYDEVLEWAGAKSASQCGTSAQGVAIYCVAVDRIPSMNSNTAITIGHFILYNVAPGNPSGEDYLVTLEPTCGGAGAPSPCRANYVETYSLPIKDSGLLRHEMAHVSQWEEANSTAYLFGYIADPRSFECDANLRSGTNRGACT